MVLNLTPKQPHHVNVNEMFGPTIQGEGPHMGQQVAFLRLAGCNLSCSWCDTPYSWDWENYDRDKESHKMSVEQIATKLLQYPVRRVVLTGGEPMLQQTLIPELYERTGYRIDVETNGTRKPLTEEIVAAVDLFNVSPKLAHATDPAKRRIVDEALFEFSRLAKLGKAVFKFVCKSSDDFHEIKDIQARYDIPNEYIWVMPEGYTREEHLKHLEEIADDVVDQGWNITTRIHVLAWETIRER